ncbi:MAG: hypothetical protein A3F83_01590 [Candidatus Glassbacteria bacterium RIFCSPLOWO2_12_FULL_58_11]|uniref:Uncharacterized protein n=1 Tax=Candidatus Glassbacteria bacterium RIFCSPLOWO2_12_FULL_58_11 TaxID=1817867 RepID=A0A1F5YV51_9BACT|nr:MAG: hypothetical protein A3F83_01590 [Candidatus Glassbacteria bacterium RIFCSPLOWO2_12_FULL_58_11]
MLAKLGVRILGENDKFELLTLFFNPFDYLYSMLFRHLEIHNYYIGQFLYYVPYCFFGISRDSDNFQILIDRQQGDQTIAYQL